MNSTSSFFLGVGLRWLVILISFSGHGYYVADIDGDEADGWDETIAPSDVRREANGFTGTILDDQIGAFVDRLAAATS